jgi:sigma-B regulation protein RsbU (phosphoserine phosphatase)
MPPGPLQFADTSANVRLELFGHMLKAIATATEVRELHSSLIAIMRRAYGVDCYVEVSTHGLEPTQYRITRVLRDDDTEGVPNRSPWQSEGVPIRTGGVVSQVVSRSQPSLLPAFSFPGNDPAFAELGGYHTLAATPGALGDRHNWVFIFDKSAGSLDAVVLQDLVLRVMLIGSALRNLRTATELSETYRKLVAATAYIEAEVDRIATIQRCLLPPPNPVVPGLDVAAWSETFDRAGGDQYDYVILPNGQWACMISDASGHGPSAAVVAAILNTLLHSLFRRPANDTYVNCVPALLPNDVLALANDELADKQIEHSFVTAFLAIWDPATATLIYARAGHNPPLFMKAADGTIAELDAASGLPLGLFPKQSFDQATIRLSPGDVLLMFSDGIIEAENPAGEPFDMQQLQATLMASRHSTAREMLIAIRSAVQTHQQGSRPQDDQTLLVLKAI